MSQIEDMVIFIRIVESGSITKAADQLNMVKSAVSRRLKALEENLGVKLLNRTTRQSHLTEEGEYFYENAKRIIDEVKALNERTSGASSNIEGTLRISVPLSFGLKHFDDIVDDFINEHPDITFEIDFSDRKVDLVEEGFELAIRIGRLKDSSYQARKLTTIGFSLCASPEYLKEKGTPETIEDLKQHVFLQYGLEKRVTIEFICENNRRFELPVSSKIKSTNGEFLTNMAINHHGITHLPSFLSYDALNRGDLVEILPRYHLPPLTAYAVYPQNRFLSQRCRLFIDHIKNSFGDKPFWQ